MNDPTPLATTAPLPFEAPAFDRIKDEDHAPAIESGMREQLAEVEAIIADTAVPTFENTVVAMERTGRQLTRAKNIFFNLTGSATNDALQRVKAALMPKLAAHDDAITMNDALFQRVQAVYQGRRDAGLDPVQERLVERYHARFVRAGALLDNDGKERLKELNAEEAKLRTLFEDNVLKARSTAAVIVEDRSLLDGLGEEAIDAAAEAARVKGHQGRWLIELINTTGQPVLASLKDRDLRERIHRASIGRNTSGTTDNRPIIARLAQLRAQKAGLLGFPNWAAYVMDDQMSKTPEAAVALLSGLVPNAARNAKAEAIKLQALAEEQGAGINIRPWDWDYYSEQVRKAEYDLDEAALKPYLEFERVLVKGVLFAAEKLYGLTFRERHDLPVYHPDVRVFDIFDADGSVIGLFYGDYFARDNKSGGAWMSSFVDQSSLLHQQPVITQNCNYVRPAPGQPCLLGFDDVITLFHEFGHALHGMLSTQVYPFFSGTATATDFVEFPSQINEALATDPEVLANYARHYRTGEAMPAALVAKMKRARTFNQGYATSEYLAAALLDIEWHSQPPDAPQVTDVGSFERTALKKYGLDDDRVPPRYKSSYFSHIWGGGYAANYYAYMWSEVLDADGCAWFEEHGGSTRENGMHFRRTVLSKGGSKDGRELYHDFAGREPRLEPLLARRGLN
ncbi:MAG: M3 family metallopeptidase [Flavobacteriales bacterium]|nr:M3 family metallopeptidase [Flavobacteriales bacterium]